MIHHQGMSNHYLQKCFSYCLSQNKGDLLRKKEKFICIFSALSIWQPQKQCKENKLNWCKWLQIPDTFFTMISQMVKI